MTNTLPIKRKQGALNKPLKGKEHMKKTFLLLIIIDAILFGLVKFDVEIPKLSFGKNRINQSSHVRNSQRAQSKNSYNKATTKSSYNIPASGSQFSGNGRVTRVLSDDNIGSRHQRFILTLPSSQTILIAHNIDIAPRVPSLRVGDTISFNGIYERNSKGGVVHWTHRDPNGRHAAGWLKKNGRTYQ